MMQGAVVLQAFDDQEAEAWFGPLLLNQIEQFLRRCVAYPSEHAVVAHVLWILHAHLMDCWESTPRLAFLSAERGSGKTRALEVTALLVPNAVQAINVTPAYLFRKVGDTEAPPTILYDEVDTLFGSKVTDTGEVRALLNAGHRRGAVTGRCVGGNGKRIETEEIPAYCAVALAGIGDLPDTIGSRSIIVEMRRRAPDEQVEPFRPRIHDAEGRNLRTMIEQWCAAVGASLSNAEPTLPNGIVDRDADCWEALIAIADAAGEQWPARARAAAVALVAGGAERTLTPGIQLLSDLRDIFGNADKLATSFILEQLHALPESPWKDLRGKPLDERGLAARLKKYGVKPKRLRLHGEAFLRGYEAADLHDAWSRYLPSPQEAPQAPQAPRTAEKTTINASENQSVADVADVALAWKVATDDHDPFAAFKDPTLLPKQRRA
jgi:hypothetical protein